jgi:hypothetical protein
MNDGAFSLTWDLPLFGEFQSLTVGDMMKQASLLECVESLRRAQQSGSDSGCLHTDVIDQMPESPAEFPLASRSVPLVNYASCFISAL